MLSLGILAFRWVSLGWMVVLALTAGELRRPALAVVMIAVVGAWTAWLTVARPRPTWPVLAADLALAVALNLVAGLVMPADTVGERPYFAAGYPVAAAVTWGAARASAVASPPGWCWGSRWPPAARSPPTRWPGWPRWPPARNGPCGR